jgi:nicotinate-nucleotide adenylyltransferase
MKGKKIGLFFGSFNPIHHGHLMIANYMAEFDNLEQVWFVISPLNPFKSEQTLLADYHRRELLNRAIGDYPRFKISVVEFKLPKPSYTIDTLLYLTEHHPDHQFSLIMGSDQIADFHLWKNSAQILETYKVLIYPRPGSHNSNNKILINPAVMVEEAPLLDISSSFIRKAIHEGKDVRFFMPDLAWQYIDEMHFYR